MKRLMKIGGGVAIVLLGVLGLVRYRHQQEAARRVEYQVLVSVPANAVPYMVEGASIGTWSRPCVLYGGGYENNRPVSIYICTIPRNSLDEFRARVACYDPYPNPDGWVLAVIGPKNAHLVPNRYLGCNGATWEASVDN